MRSKHQYSSRRQVEKESRFSAAGRVPQPHRISVITISLTTGRELNTETTVQRPTDRPSSPTVGLLPALGANGGINHVASPGMVAVSGEGGRIFGVFSLPWPIAWRPSGLEAGQFRQRSHSHQVVPVGPAHRDTEQQK